MRRLELEPTDRDGTWAMEEANKELAGAVHVETYTLPAVGYGPGERILVIFAFYPDKEPRTLRDLAGGGG